MDIIIDSKSVGLEVITETGVRLGWLKQIRIDSSNGVRSLVLTSVKMPPWFSWARSRYEISARLVTCVSYSRILVNEGAEEQTLNLKVGLIEKIGFGYLPWHQQNKGHICLAVTTPRGNEEGNTGSLCPAPRPNSPNDSDDSARFP